MQENLIFYTSFADPGKLVKSWLLQVFIKYACLDSNSRPARRGSNPLLQRNNILGLEIDFTNRVIQMFIFCGKAGDFGSFVVLPFYYLAIVGRNLTTTGEFRGASFKF